jgi:Na+-translocating ferredoxin:NAD+ oxidoreductase subunit B
MLRRMLLIFLFLSVLFLAAADTGKYRVIPEKCIGCQLCVSTCTVKAISMSGNKAVIDPAKCINCGLCAGKCPVKAIVPPPPPKKTVAYKVDMKKCTGCSECVEPCPVKAISVVRGKAVIDTEKCVSCGLCSNNCRSSAPLRTGI